jgi:hypothetical protein
MLKTGIIATCFHLKSPYWHGHKRATFVAFLLPDAFQTSLFKTDSPLKPIKTYPIQPVHFSFSQLIFASPLIHFLMPLISFSK